MKKLSPGIVFGIVLVVIAIIVLIVFFLLSEGEKADEPENGQPVALYLSGSDGNFFRWASKNATNASCGTAILMRVHPAA